VGEAIETVTSKAVKNSSGKFVGEATGDIGQDIAEEIWNQISEYMDEDEGSSNSSVPKLTSSIHKDPRLIKAAMEMGKNERIQQEANHLINELLSGNTNPGIGTQNLFKDITYLRGKNGARIFYRTTNEGYEILAKANKANEQTVINILKKLYG